MADVARRSWYFPTYPRRGTTASRLELSYQTRRDWPLGLRWMLRRRTFDGSHPVFMSGVSMPPATGNSQWENFLISREWPKPVADFKSLVSVRLSPLGTHCPMGTLGFWPWFSERSLKSWYGRESKAINEEARKYFYVFVPATSGLIGVSVFLILGFLGFSTKLSLPGAVTGFWAGLENPGSLFHLVWQRSHLTEVPKEPGIWQALGCLSPSRY